MAKIVNYLEEEKPLITIPMDKLNEFIKISNKYNWEITDIKENLYRTTTPEVIVNGLILDSQKDVIHKFECLKQSIKVLLTLNKI